MTCDSPLLIKVKNKNALHFLSITSIAAQSLRDLIHMLPCPYVQAPVLPLRSIAGLPVDDESLRDARGWVDGGAEEGGAIFDKAFGEDDKLRIADDKNAEPGYGQVQRAAW